MKNYTLKDSGISYILCIVLSIAVSFLVVNLATIVSSSYAMPVEDVMSQNWFLYVNMLISELVFLVSFFFVVGLKKDKTFVKTSKLNFHFDIRVFLGVVFLGIIAMFASINATGLVNHLFSFLSPLKLSSSLGVEINTFGQFALLVLLLAVFPAICEELVFRGIIYNGLRQKMSAKWAIVVSAAMFAFIHFSIYKTFYQLILGAILGLLVYYTGTIFYGMIFHFVNNFTIILVEYLTHGNRLFEFSVWGAKEVLISLLIFVVGVVLVVLFFNLLKNYTKNNPNTFNLEETNLPLCPKVVVNNKNYDEVLLENRKESRELAWFLVAVAMAAVIWALSSFGSVA